MFFSGKEKGLCFFDTQVCFLSQYQQYVEQGGLLSENVTACALLKEAIENFLQRKYSEASDKLEEVLSADENCAWGYICRALVYMELWCYDEAVADLSKAMILEPNIGLSYHLQGHLYNILKQPQAACDVWRRGAAVGSAESKYCLGEMYATNGDTEEDLQQSLYWFTNAAESGSKNAQLRLGNSYYFAASGLAKDKEKALFWFRRAALQGEKIAQYNTGMMCLYGDGVMPDYQEALKWLELAAEQGYGDAQNELGEVYYEDVFREVVCQNKPQAYCWSVLADANGNQNAAENLAKYMQKMTAEEIAAGEELLFQRVAKNFAKESFRYDRRGNSFEREGKFREAIAEYSKDISIEPDGYIYQRRAALYIKIGDYAEAIEDYKRAIVLESENSAFYSELVCALCSSERYAEALENADAGIQMQENKGDKVRWDETMDLYFVRGCLHYKMGQKEESAADYEQGAKRAEEIMANERDWFF